MTANMYMMNYSSLKQHNLEGNRKIWNRIPVDVKLYHTVKHDTLNLMDISMFNCTISWQLLGVMYNITLKFNFLFPADN